jgi:hypothetical protein
MWLTVSSKLERVNSMVQIVKKSLFSLGTVRVLVVYGYGVTALALLPDIAHWL